MGARESLLTLQAQLGESVIGQPAMVERLLLKRQQ